MLTNKGNERSDIATDATDYFNIDLMLIDLKKCIVATINYWNSKLTDFSKKSKQDSNPDISEPATPETAKSIPSKL